MRFFLYFPSLLSISFLRKMYHQCVSPFSRFSPRYKTYQVRRSLFYWLNRRNQKKSYTWEAFNAMLKDYPLACPVRGKSTRPSIWYSSKPLVDFQRQYSTDCILLIAPKTSIISWKSELAQFQKLDKENKNV